MRKSTMILTAPFLAIVLAACSDSKPSNSNNAANTPSKEPVTNENTKKDTDKQSESENEATTTNNVIPFEEFKIDIEYPDGEYTIDYEKKLSGEEAEIEDERIHEDVKGKVALERTKTILQKLSIDNNTTEKEVKKQLINHFKIDDNYSNIELEIQFANDKKKEYYFQ